MFFMAAQCSSIFRFEIVHLRSAEIDRIIDQNNEKLFSPPSEPRHPSTNPLTKCHV